VSSEPGGAASERVDEPGAAQAGAGEPGAGEPGAGAGEPGAGPSEQELRDAYEAELSRVTSAEMVLQAAVSLLNIGGYRLGAPAGPDRPGGGGRDLDQVRDAIDGVRGLLPILERRMAAELGPLRDALSRLQMAYAREAAVGAKDASREGAGEQPAGGDRAGGDRQGSPPQAPSGREPGDDQRPQGPAEASGRLWVPGR